MSDGPAGPRKNRGRVAEGSVEETLPKSLFRVRLEDGAEVRATLSPQAKRVTVKLLPGDRVQVNVSAYDPTRGRILKKL